MVKIFEKKRNVSRIWLYLRSASIALHAPEYSNDYKAYSYALWDVPAQRGRLEWSWEGHIPMH